MTDDESPLHLDLRGKTITTYIVSEAVRQLDDAAVGAVIELEVDASAAIDGDLRVWAKMAGHKLELVSDGESERTYRLVKGVPEGVAHRLAIVISQDGLEELLSPLSFSLAAAFEGLDVSLYFQGPGVKVLTRGFTEHLGGIQRLFSRFARRALAKSGHVAAQEKVLRLAELGAHFYVCEPSTIHYRIDPTDLVLEDFRLAEYFTFTPVMQEADIQLYV